MIEQVAIILRGPGAACYMNEHDSFEAAREIIAAMREPTPAMLRAMFNETAIGQPMTEQDRFMLTEIWHAGIDKAREE